MKKTLRKRIGQRIKNEREGLGMTQEEFAKAAKISRGFLSDIERAARAIGVETFIRLCATARISPEELVTP